MLKKIESQVKIIILSGMVVVTPVSALGSTQTDVEPNGVSGGATIGEVLYESPNIVNEVQSIWQKISSGNLEGAIEGILGAIGLLNPAHESARISNGEDGDNPYSDPETPEEVYELEQHTDIVRSQIPQQLSQVVFSPKGQKALAEQSAQVQAIQEVSNQAQQATSLVFQDSKQLAQTSTTHAENIEELAQEAESAQASQDILKALAAQNNDLAQIMAGNSSQLAQLGEIGVYTSVQLNGVTAQLKTLNDTGQTLEVLLASQNYLMSQVDDALGQQKDYQQYKDTLKNSLNRNMTQMVYIPGLFGGGGDE